MRTLKALGYHTPADIVSLEQHMWKNGNGRGGKGFPCGIFTVAAANFHGVPEGGAPRCLKALLDAYGKHAWRAPDFCNACERAKHMQRIDVLRVISEIE